jgi:two-component system sensor kinase FixL
VDGTRELSGRRKNGGTFPVDVGVNIVRGARGTVVLATVTDVSKRKELEEEARQRLEQVDFLSRLSLLGEMTSSIAHELNQPLSAIISNANAGQRFIEGGIADPDTLREILVDVAADGRRAHDVIQSIRNTIKKGAAHRERLDLNQIVKNVSHLIQPNARLNSCRMEIKLADNLPTVEGDPVQIQQVLINLVTNAFDAMSETPPAKRKVEISTERKDGDSICVNVRDHGSGIPDCVHQQLFQQFFTTKPDGLGLGLPIVRSIIEAHGGRIAVENIDSGGARFHFTLPTNGD